MTKGRRVGYARTTSKGFTLEEKIEKLSDCDIIFQDNISDENSLDRTELQKALEYLQKGDLLVVTQLRCLFINIENFSDVSAILRAKDVDLVILELELDKDFLESITGRFFYRILSSLGVFKRGAVAR